MDLKRLTKPLIFATSADVLYLLLYLLAESMEDRTSQIFIIFVAISFNVVMYIIISRWIKAQIEKDNKKKIKW